jgi:hypothetical protein
MYESVGAVLILLTRRNTVERRGRGRKEDQSQRSSGGPIIRTQRDVTASRSAILARSRSGMETSIVCAEGYHKPGSLLEHSLEAHSLSTPPGLLFYHQPHNP